VERKQRAWLEDDLATHSSQRTFLCTHYPLFVSDPKESSSYDNIDEPGRTWLLNLLKRHKTEAVFAGHVHNCWYNCNDGTKHYLLPSTAFVRQDYSELYKGEPGPENGRDDGPKLGYAVVDVYENGHVTHIIRTNGELLDPGELRNLEDKRLPRVHTRTNTRAPVGLDLRHPWAEIVEIAPSGGVDEFERKRARNDYPLFAMWEIGVQKLRVPIQDIVDPYTRERMYLMKEMGHQFAIYSYDLPAQDVIDIAAEHHQLISFWEVILPWRQLADRLGYIREIKKRAPISIYLAKFRTHDEDQAKHSPPGIASNTYSHMIKYGFYGDEKEELKQLCDNPYYRQAIDGVAFRIDRERSPLADIHTAAEISGQLGLRVAAQVRFAASKPAVVLNDDLATANRVAETIIAALTADGVDVFLDTFHDVDRSFFARAGLVDRRYNPRLGSHVFGNLHAALGSRRFRLTDGGVRPHLDGHLLTFGTSAESFVMVLPHKQMSISELPMMTERAEQSGDATIIDLRTGLVTYAKWSRSAKASLLLCRPIPCGAPLLIKLDRQSERDD
jgi:hypothetical protein